MVLDIKFIAALLAFPYGEKKRSSTDSLSGLMR
jgi:hypothetical protein